jgi:hypothetical protein
MPGASWRRFVDGGPSSRHREAMLRRRVRWLGLLVLAAPACGSGNGAAPFMPTTPVADPCSMLALADVQVLLPGAPAGVPLSPDDSVDVWSRGCAWQASGMSVTMVVQGALMSDGTAVIGANVEATSDGATQATAVSGVGDKAVYLDTAGLSQVLNARKGSELVSLVAASFTPDVPEASLQPLVVEGLGNL